MTALRRLAVLSLVLGVGHIVFGAHTRKDQLLKSFVGFVRVFAEITVFGQRCIAQPGLPGRQAISMEGV